MRRFGFVFTLFCLLLTACAAPPADIPATSPGSAMRTATPSSTSSPALHLTPETPTPDTPTITPLPTIPTFTPTFDVRTIVTATPAPNAECPNIVPAENVYLDFLDFSFENEENRLHDERNILEFLNLHGATALYQFAKSLPGFSSTVLEDLTNDGEPELVIAGAFSRYIFGCKNGEYITLLKFTPDAFLHIPTIQGISDMNKNGLPELTVLLGFASQGGHTFGIYEWNGESFTSLVSPEYGSIWVEATGKIHCEDTNQDSIKELVVNSGIPVWLVYHDDLPWRNKLTTYFWNGEHYTPGYREFTPPEFRFQAIQDGDLALSQQEYDKAIEFYQQAIFDAELKAYSPEIRQNLQDAWTARIGPDKTPTPTPVPPDPTEYPRLAAYATYRMIILHTFLGEMESAQVKYATMQEKFSVGSPGHPYVEMTTGFWNAFQSSGRMYEACAAAIAYADAHPEILVPLGSDYHGAQSHRYQPADVCPFR